MYIFDFIGILHAAPNMPHLAVHTRFESHGHVCASAPAAAPNGEHPHRRQDIVVRSARHTCGCRRRCCRCRSEHCTSMSVSNWKRVHARQQTRSPTIYRDVVSRYDVCMMWKRVFSSVYVCVVMLTAVFPILNKRRLTSASWKKYGKVYVQAAGWE